LWWWFSMNPINFTVGWQGRNWSIDIKPLQVDGVHFGKQRQLPMIFRAAQSWQEDIRPSRLPIVKDYQKLFTMLRPYELKYLSPLQTCPNTFNVSGERTWVW
jgi:hypothetical protein